MIDRPVQPTSAIFCGGASRRMGPLARGRPKTLLPAFDQPLLWRQIEQLREAGFEQIEVVTTPALARYIGESLDRLRRSVEIGDGTRVRVCGAQEHGVLWGVRAVLESASAERVLLSLGDIFFLSNPFISMRSHLTENYDCVSAAAFALELEIGRGGLVVQRNGSVQGLIEHPDDEIPEAPLRWSGVILVDRRSSLTDLETYLTSAEPDARPGDFVDFRCRKGVAARVVDCPDFVNVNTPDELLLASIYARMEAATGRSGLSRDLALAAASLRHEIAARSSYVATP